MSAPVKGLQAAEEATAEALLGSLKTLAAAERRKHATVLNYWLSIRKDRDLPPIRDLDPLEISDAGPFSVLLELIGGGEDAGLVQGILDRLLGVEHGVLVGDLDLDDEAGVGAGDDGGGHGGGSRCGWWEPPA